MRIVSGELGGRKIDSPTDDSTRPTSERVREAVFNSLFSAGVTEGASVLDLFGGSGAMGLEALSRGAAHCTFVESSPVALKVLRANIDSLGVGDQATVIPADAIRYLDACPSFDLAIIDPPYAFDQWETVLEKVDATVIVVESGEPQELGERWVSFKAARYGATVVSLARTASSRGSQPAN